MADYKGVISDLRMRRDALQRDVMRLNDMIAELERMSGTAQDLFTSIPPAPFSFKGETLKSSVERALDLGTEFLDTQQVIEILQQGGYESRAQRLYPSVYSTLFRLSEGDGPVVKSANGKKWGLRKWQKAA